VRRMPASNTIGFKPLKVNTASNVESGSATSRDQAPIKKPSDSESVAVHSIELLASDAKTELDDDEIHSQFSEKTDSVSSFDASETCPVEGESEGVARGRSSLEVTEKENVVSTCEKPRKRRVTTSVSSTKAPDGRKCTPARQHGSKPNRKKTKRPGPPEPPTAQTHKQTTLSAWLKKS
jgi:hypothetical protein